MGISVTKETCRFLFAIRHISPCDQPYTENTLTPFICAWYTNQYGQYFSISHRLLHRKHNFRNSARVLLVKRASDSSRIFVYALNHTCFERSENFRRSDSRTRENIVTQQTQTKAYTLPSSKWRRAQ